MQTFRFRRWAFLILLSCTLSTSPARAADVAPVIVGKNNWLFLGYEFAHAADKPDTEASLDLLQKVNKLFEMRGIGLALVIVPSKIRIHADQLPAGVLLDSYTAAKYDNMTTTLRSNGVNVVNLNQPFLDSPLRNSDTPLFLRLDTHWTPAGALLAAETVSATLTQIPKLQAALAGTPIEQYRFSWSDRKVPHRARDLVRQLPVNAQGYLLEQIRLFRVTRANPAAVDLLGSGENIGITAIGSSYSHRNTGFPDALRYTLQRNLLDISIPGDQGPWVGMENYLRDSAFKTAPPKLILWELPERELRSPPNYKFRDARYISGNDEWYARIVELLKPPFGH